MPSLIPGDQPQRVERLGELGIESRSTLQGHGRLPLPAGDGQVAEAPRGEPEPHPRPTLRGGVTRSARPSGLDGEDRLGAVKLLTHIALLGGGAEGIDGDAES